MKLNYYEDTDSLYIDLSSEASADWREIADELVIDFNEAGSIVGIDIQHASERIDFGTVESTHLPVIRKTA